MLKTSHYQLNQWDAEDRIRMDDFNHDNAKLDAALKQQADALNSQSTALASETAARKKAISTETAARENAVSSETKARKSAVENLEQTLAELESRPSLQTILTKTLTSAAESLTLDLSDVDWSAWKAVHFIYDVKGNTAYSLSFNGTKDTSAAYGAPSGIYFSALVLNDANRYVSGILWMPIGEFKSTGIQFNALTQIGLLTVSTSSPLGAGTTLTVKGEK